MVIIVRLMLIVICDDDHGKRKFVTLSEWTHGKPAFMQAVIPCSSVNPSEQANAWYDPTSSKRMFSTSWAMTERENKDIKKPWTVLSQKDALIFRWDVGLCQNVQCFSFTKNFWVKVFTKNSETFWEIVPEIYTLVQICMVLIIKWLTCSCRNGSRTKSWALVNSLELESGVFLNAL